MKTLFITIFILSANCFSYAQSFIRNCEIEVGPSVIYKAKKYGSSIDPSWNLMAEARYNFPENHFDIGLQFGLGAFSRDWNNTELLYTNYHFKNILIVSDYNFGRGENISPFAGIGIGAAIQKIDVVTTGIHDHHWHDHSFCFMPRVGIEFFRIVRLSTSYKLMKKEYSNFECTLGLVVGNWKKTK